MGVFGYILQEFDVVKFNVSLTFNILIKVPVWVPLSLKLFYSLF